MVRIYIDFDAERQLDQIYIRLDHYFNKNVDGSSLKVCEIVTVYDEEIECEGALLEGDLLPWLVEIDRSTIRPVSRNATD